MPDRLFILATRWGLAFGTLWPRTDGESEKCVGFVETHTGSARISCIIVALAGLGEEGKPALGMRR
jgi:hypothetical protein